MTEFAVLLEGINDFNLDELSRRRIATSAQRAINRVARDGRVDIGRRILRESNLPARYVSPSQKRLTVSQQASRTSLEAKITASARNTSLAQFVRNAKRPGEPGLYVEVSPGRVRFMKRAFLIRLPQGSTITDTKFNLGLAIRLKRGERLENKRSARRIASGLYLLYGPSVDQIFRAADGGGVASDLAPELADDLQDEFLRQMNL